MSSVVHVLLPIFGLILAGFVCRRKSRLGEAAASELNKFVVWLCLPALMFRSTALADWQQLWHPGFMAVFALSMMVLFAATVVVRCRSTGRSMADASIDGLSAAYANTGYVGIPLCLLVFGDEGLLPALISTLLVACVLFAVAIICIEIGLQAEATMHHAALKVVLALLKNPLIVSPIAGIAWMISGLGLPQPIDKFLELLGDATIPCALVSMGAFLAVRPTGERGNGSVWPLTILKLVVHPLLTWVLAVWVFGLPPLWANAALLLAALPTGTGPYMLAELYQREASVISGVILYSTLGSIVTLSLCLYLVQT